MGILGGSGSLEQIKAVDVKVHRYRSIPMFQHARTCITKCPYGLSDLKHDPEHSLFTFVILTKLL